MRDDGEGSIIYQGDTTIINHGDDNTALWIVIAVLLALLCFSIIAALWYWMIYRKRQLANQTHEVNKDSVVIGNSVDVARSLPMEGVATTTADGTKGTSMNFNAKNNSAMGADNDVHVTPMGLSDDDVLPNEDYDEDGNELVEE